MNRSIAFAYCLSHIAHCHGDIKLLAFLAGIIIYCSAPVFFYLNTMIYEFDDDDVDNIPFLASAFNSNSAPHLPSSSILLFLVFDFIYYTMIAHIVHMNVLYIDAYYFSFQKINVISIDLCLANVYTFYAIKSSAFPFTLHCHPALPS